MKILHISSDYPYTSVYKQLLLHFRIETGQSHLMYVPLPKYVEYYNGLVSVSPNAEVLYSNDFTNVERLLFWRKVGRIRKSIETQTPISDMSAIHAHYLFSAGGVAYQIRRLHGIPYIAAVRNTDINMFFKYAIHLRRFGVEILKEASKVVFISPAGQKALIDWYLPDDLKEAVWNKSEVIPNGLDSFWLQNLYSKPSRSYTDNSIRLLYVGEVSKNKNVETSIKVTDVLCARGYDASLDVVGDGTDIRRVMDIAGNRLNVIRFHGRVDSKIELMKLYRNADVFIMPSITETFGLVYLEAMSQGLPIIYTEGQGIDGYFDYGFVGYGCTPRNQTIIANRVEQILKDYDSISARCTEAVHDFAWSKIASRYEEIYSSLK